jgi:ferredoxin
MKLKFFSREHTKTPYIQLDTRKCKACWKCLENCPGQAIHKIDLAWHKHVLIVAPAQCIGCLKCIKVCEHEAYSKVDIVKKEITKFKNKVLYDFIVNNLLMLSGMLMTVSGLILQLGFHIGNSEGKHGGRIQTHVDNYEQVRGVDALNTVLGINYSNWSLLHKFAITVFSLLMMYHVFIHWKWYKVVINNHLAGKNIQVLLLSIFFVLVAVTGLVPWFIDLSGGNGMLRLIFIELHDKLALVLVIYLTLHIVKRYKWFISTYTKMKNRN